MKAEYLIPRQEKMKFSGFRHKSIERTVDAYPGLSPEERFKLLMIDESKYKYSPEILNEIFKNIKLKQSNNFN